VKQRQRLSAIHPGRARKRALGSLDRAAATAGDDQDCEGGDESRHADLL
jgi:hypothetical protein